MPNRNQTSLLRKPSRYFPASIAFRSQGYQDESTLGCIPESAGIPKFASLVRSGS